MTKNPQADSVQRRKSLFARYCLDPSYSSPSRTFRHLPFDADVYDVGKMTEDDINRLNELAVQAVINVTVKDESVYAPDRQHSSLLFDPRNPETMRNFYINDKGYHGGGYNGVLYKPGHEQSLVHWFGQMQGIRPQ